jgi:hypothetical protein
LPHRARAASFRVEAHDGQSALEFSIRGGNPRSESNTFLLQFGLCHCSQLYWVLVGIQQLAFTDDASGHSPPKKCVQARLLFVFRFWLARLVFDQCVSLFRSCDKIDLAVHAGIFDFQSHFGNSRVRASFAKSKARNGTAARLATGRDKYLAPFPVEHAEKTYDASRTVELPAPKNTAGTRRYVLTTAQLPNDAFYAVELKSDVLELKLNTDHAFFESVYLPICTRGDKALQIAIECFLFALARAEAEAQVGAQQYWYNRKRVAWSNILATFLGS